VVWDFAISKLVLKLGRPLKSIERKYMENSGYGNEFYANQNAHGGNEKKMKDSVRKWLLVAARKEQNPYMQAEILYSALKGKRKKYE
jgi:hypothetical protein